MRSTHSRDRLVTDDSDEDRRFVPTLVESDAHAAWSTASRLHDAPDIDLGPPRHESELSLPGRRSSAAVAAKGADGDRVARSSRHIDLPFELLKRGNFITPDAPKSQIALEYRVARRALLRDIEDKQEAGVENANVILVTSCVEGEGKTFTAVNLAMSLVQDMDQRVLLVDTDVTKQAVGEVLGIERDLKGLVDCLSGDDTAVEPFVYPTNLENLFLMPTGATDDHATELISSARAVRLISALSRRYADHVVLLDASPVLLTSEPEVLAERAAQTLFVVAAERTTQSMVQDALSRIRGLTDIRLFLNHTRRSNVQRYGYGYGYGAAQSSAGER